MNNILNLSRVIAAFCFFLPWCSSSAAQELDYQGEVKFSGIVRFNDLPRRMYLEPELKLPADEYYLEDSMAEFLKRILRSAPDNEMLVEAIRSLKRVQLEEHADVADVGADLQKYLTENKNRQVQQACASTLAAIGNAEFATVVAECCVPRYESLCLEVEPDFVRWGGAAMKATWLDRIEHPDAFSSPLLALACDGLAQLNEKSAVPALESLVTKVSVHASVRHATAGALGRINGTRAAEIAQSLANRAVIDRLCACALLEHTESDVALQLLSKLCDDESNAVASRGWQILTELKPSVLVNRLDRGRMHADANVRLAVIQVLHKLPTVAGCDILHAMTADVHIGVRNSARNELRTVALTNSAFKQQILDNAGMSVRDTSTNWQQLEQLLVLLAELRHRELQPECVRLLQHPRAEVYVTAAWLLHLMPDPGLADAINLTTTARFETINTYDNLAGNLQLTFLFQHAGLVRAESLQPLCEKQFSKIGAAEKRAAGLWAIGKIHTDDPDQVLVDKLVERIFDDSPFAPEEFRVRRMSVLALAYMNARSTASELKRAREKYGVHSLLGEAARWALAQWVAEQFPPLESPRIEIGGFPFGPL
jgi:hypothetical protein